MAAAAAFLSVLSSSRLRAGPVPGHAPLQQPGHLAPAVEAVRPAFFLSDHALHSKVRHQAAASSFDEIPMEAPRHVAPVHLRREALVCPIADAQVLVPDSVAEPVLPRLALHLAPHLAVVLAGDYVLARTVVHARKLKAAYLSPLQLDHLALLVREIVRRVCHGLCPARPVGARHFHAVRSAALCRDDLDRLVCVLRMAGAKHVRHLHLELLLPRDADVLQPCPFRAPVVPAKCLTRVARSRRA